MNQDTDPLFLKSGDYIDALNVVDGDSGESGAQQGQLGTTLIVNSNEHLLLGDNTVIGAIEDKQTGSLYYLIYNTLASDSIFRWNPNSPLDDKLERIAASDNFLFAAPNRIQGAIVDGKYLYWTDGRVMDNVLTGNEPRKLDVEKANVSNKDLVYFFYGDLFNPAAFDVGQEYTFTVYSDGVEVFATTLVADGDVVGLGDEFIDWVYEQLIAEGAGRYLTIETCNSCKLTITAPVGTHLVLTIAGNTDALLVPINHFPITSTGLVSDFLQPQHFDLLKTPPTYAPEVSYVKDDSTSVNNVLRGTYQFRCRYIYDDGERSAWGPISNMALNLGVDGLPINDLNAIEIDFSDERFADVAWMTMIEKVEIAVREGNDEVWKTIKTLERCEIGLTISKYTWLNDQNYAAVPSDDPSQGSPTLQVLKLFDEVPRIVGSLDAATGSNGDQRLYLANLLEGYDCPDCVDLQVQYDEYNLDGTVDIIGSIRFLDEDGGSEVSPSFFSTLRKIPVYLAGTNYYGLADFDDKTFTIKNVPIGVYILRVASYACVFNDDNGPRHNLNNGLDWQRSSSPVLDCAGSQADTGVATERIIDLTSFVGTTFDLDTEVGFGPIDIQNGYAAESTIKVFEIYVTDPGIDLDAGVDTHQTIGTAIYNGLGVERLEVTYDDGTNPIVNRDTDHNGFVWFKATVAGTAIIGVAGMNDFISWHPNPFSSPHNRTWDSPYDGDVSNPSFLSVVANHTGGSYSQAITLLAGLTWQIFLCNRLESWTTSARKLMYGTVKDANGDGVSGVLVAYTRNGRQEFTDVFGNYSFAMYPPNTGTVGDPRNDDFLVITYPNDVAFLYPSVPASPIAITVDPWDDKTYGDITFAFYGGLAVVQRLLKNGAFYKLGIVYEGPGNQSCGVAPAGSITIPFPTEAGAMNKYRVLWSIWHNPPSWATHYRLVRTKNLLHARYFQWVTDEVLFAVVTNPTAAPDLVDFSAANWNYILIRVNTQDVADSQALSLFFSERAEGYTPVVGDRVRFMFDENGDTLATGSILEVDVAGTYIDGDNYYVVLPRVEFGTTAEPQAGWSFEFYTPKGVDEPFYYETGDNYPILDAGTDTARHGGQISDQILGSNPATGYLTGGDTYWRFKLFNTVGAGIRFETENTTISPYHITPAEDIGRAFVEATSGELWRYNRIRFSDLYVPNSEINGLSSFGSLDFVDINRASGPITALRYITGNMLAICRYKAQSLYLGQGNVLDLRGQETVGRSDQVIQIANESITDVGTANPESVVVEHGRAYWWDGYRGRVWRYSQAGVEPIDGGLYGAFQMLGAQRRHLTAEDDIVCGAFDRLYGFYLLSFQEAEYLDPDRGLITLDANTYAYSEKKDGWKTRLSYVPECFGVLANKLISFVAGNLWLHHDLEIINRFYGVDYVSTIKFAVNDQPESVKDWHCLTIHTDVAWQASEITIPANLNYKSGMLSRLKFNKFKSYEGDLSADFLRDINDTSGWILAITDDTEREATALLRGRPLKGNVLLITLATSDDGNPFRLWYTISEWSDSQKTGM